MRGGRKAWVGIAVGCAVAAVVLVAVITAGSDATGDSDGDGNLHHETVPCTGLEEPVNFEVFSAGQAPAGMPLTDTSRRCDIDVPARGWPNNYVHYSYGNCEIPEGATGCAPPLQIQTWPACQRARDEYTFEGKPLPFRLLPKYGGAEVVEFTFPAERIEVYTKSATIVIFAKSRNLARRAVRLLRPQEEGKPPATNAEALGGVPPEGLPPPSDGSTEGDLPCQS